MRARGWNWRTAMLGAGLLACLASPLWADHGGGGRVGVAVAAAGVAAAAWREEWREEWRVAQRAACAKPAAAEWG